jgi:hypothetical protein
MFLHSAHVEASWARGKPKRRRRRTSYSAGVGLTGSSSPGSGASHVDANGADALIIRARSSTGAAARRRVCRSFSNAAPEEGGRNPQARRVGLLRREAPPL